MNVGNESKQLEVILLVTSLSLSELSFGVNISPPRVKGIVAGACQNSMVVRLASLNPIAAWTIQRATRVSEVPVGSGPAS